MPRFQLSRPKLKQAIVRALQSCTPEQTGAVKLHKVLYYSDMVSFLESGAPITGAEYRKRPHGPTFDGLLSVLAEMERDGVISIEAVTYFGYLKKQFRLLRGGNFDLLSEAETKILDEVIEFVCHHNTARSISEFSHDVVWEMVDSGDVIPYHSAFNWLPSEVEDADLEWATDVREQVASTRPIRATEVEGRPSSDLRRILHAVPR